MDRFCKTLLGVPALIVLVLVLSGCAVPSSTKIIAVQSSELTDFKTVCLKLHANDSSKKIQKFKKIRDYFERSFKRQLSRLKSYSIVSDCSVTTSKLIVVDVKILDFRYVGTGNRIAMRLLIGGVYVGHSSNSEFRVFVKYINARTGNVITSIAVSDNKGSSKSSIRKVSRFIVKKFQKNNKSDNPNITDDAI